MERADPEAIVECSVFFDFRLISGSQAICAELRSHLTTLIDQSPQFLIQLAKNALVYTPPLRMFGTIIRHGGKENPHQIDIKAPSQAIASFARLYALKIGCTETTTVTRLGAIGRSGILLDSTRRSIVTAFEALTRLRLSSQIQALQRNQEMSNWLNPAHLGQIEEVILIECFKVIELLQSRIQRDFFGASQIV